jgi:hypothetical protein
LKTKSENVEVLRFEVEVEAEAYLTLTLTLALFLRLRLRLRKRQKLKVPGSRFIVFYFAFFFSGLTFKNARCRVRGIKNYSYFKRNDEFHLAQ